MTTGMASDNVAALMQFDNLPLGHEATGADQVCRHEKHASPATIFQQVGGCRSRRAAVVEGKRNGGSDRMAVITLVLLQWLGRGYYRQFGFTHSIQIVSELPYGMLIFGGSRLSEPAAVGTVRHVVQQKANGRRIGVVVVVHRAGQSSRVEVAERKAEGKTRHSNIASE